VRTRTGGGESPTIGMAKANNVLVVIGEPCPAPAGGLTTEV
jgi:hypothetical protein